MSARVDVLDPAFAALLRCPVCAARPPLRLAADGASLICPCEQGRTFPILDGIPDLRPDDVRAPAPAATSETPCN